MQGDSPGWRAVAARFRRAAPRPFFWDRAGRRLPALLLYDAVQATDALQRARPRRPLQVAVNPSTRIPPPAGDVVRDDDTLRRLRGGILRALPPEETVKPRSALAELLRSNDVYGLERGLNVAPFSEECFMLSRRPLTPQPVAQLCSSYAAPMIKHPYTWIVKTDTELLEVSDSGDVPTPYWDPILKHSRGKRLAFYRILHRSGLLAFRRVARSRVGCFFVYKKDKLFRRLVIDARVTNALHRALCSPN